MTVYVRWYGNVIQGELLDGECLGMKQVRIPLDGHQPTALFKPGHIYQTEAEAFEKEYDPQHAKNEKFEVTVSAPEPQPLTMEEYISYVYRDDAIERFKKAHWDDRRNHLRIDALDEFYQLWVQFHSCGKTEKPTVTKAVLHTKPPQPTIHHEPVIKKPQPVKKMRCWTCEHLDYDHISDRQLQCSPGEHFCGLHGCTRVDPDGPQRDLDHQGGCGFIPRKIPVQLSLFD